MKEQRLDILQKVANGELTPEQADKQLLGLPIVGVSLPIESFDVDDWLGLTHGVWYHPFIELHNYDNGDKKSIELAQIIADYANSIIQRGSLPLQTKLEMFYDFLYERGIAKQISVGIDTIVKQFIDEKLSGNDR